MDVLSRWVATFLLNSAWQVTLVGAAATLGDLSLRRAPSRYRHALWTMALAAAVLLPAVSLRPLIKPPTALIGETRTSTRGLDPLPALARASDSSLAPSSARVPMIRRRGDHSAPPFLAEIRRGISMPQPVGRTILILYAAFLAAMLVRFGRAWLMTRATRRRALAEPLAPHVVEALERCGRVLSGSRRRLFDIWPKRAPTLRVWWSEDIPGPATVGARRPAIILPRCLREIERLDDVTAALAHESAHVVRHDYLTNLMLELLSLPIAFHPLALLMKRRCGETRELACDELAARVLDPSDYARSLVRLAHQMQRRSAAASFDYTLGVFDADILEERVMKLVKPIASGRLAKTFLVLAFLLIATAWLAASTFSLPVALAGQSEDQSAKRPAEAESSNSASSPAANQSYQVGATGGIVRTNSISGIVVDVSGARVPNASVDLVNAKTRTKQVVNVKTDETGNFAFKDVPAGHYSLEVRSSGMSAVMRTFELKAAGPAPFIAFVLEPAIPTESVVVTAKAPHGVSTNGAAAVGPRRIRVGGNVEGARLVDNLPPEYPESALQKGIQGVVLIEAVISIEGVPMSLKVLSSPSDDLAKAASDAVSEWKYSPTLLNGNPVEVVTTIAVAFHLEE